MLRIREIPLFQAIFITLFMYFSQQNHALNMATQSKQICLIFRQYIYDIRNQKLLKFQKMMNYYQLFFITQYNNFIFLTFHYYQFPWFKSRLLES